MKKMMKSGIVGWAMFFCARASAESLVPPPRYYPLDVGNTWTYEEEGRPEAVEPVVRVLAVEEGVATVSLGFTEIHIKDRNPELDIEIEGEGFVSYYRFAEGQFLHRDVLGCDDNRFLVAVSHVDVVETPAGTFTGCLRLDYQDGPCADGGSFSEWWAPEVGRVRYGEQSIFGPRFWRLKSFTRDGGAPTFRRGDPDLDGTPTLTDAVFVLNYLFSGGAKPSCLDAADANDDGQLDLSDPVAVLGYLFLGSAPPPAPGPADCGVDPTADELEDCAGASCGGGEV